MQQNSRVLHSKGTSWKTLHSLWIGWTFTLGIFSWVAFAYIGIRARHSRWVQWSIFYAAPITVAAIFSDIPQQWIFNTALAVAIIFGFVSIVHAFWVRKEYLLRLEMLEHQAASVSVTSRGKRWEWVHSLWMIWTLLMGLTSWIAFFYIGIRAGRVRWILWGAFYFAVFLFFALSDALLEEQNPLSDISIGLLIVSGVASIVHALSVRSEYLVKLERKIGEELYPYNLHNLQEPVHSNSQEQQRLRNEELPKAPPEQGSPSFGESARVSDIAEDGPESDGPVSQERRWEPYVDSVPILPATIRISEEYPLPLAYSWSLLASLWDPRDRYREQLRHAENMLAFLGSVSLALLDKEDYQEVDIDPKVAWQGGISFGSWKLLIQRSAKVFRAKEIPLASSIHKLKIGSENKGFGANIARLISLRNDYHHGRGPLVEEDMISASEEVQERLLRCMEALSFLSDHPVRLVQDFDLDRSSGNFSLKCLRLIGDGPGFPQEAMTFSRALPRGDLILDAGGGKWISLFPFLAASNCSQCRYRETYFIERWNSKKGIVDMKSFERGHPEERGDVSEALGLLVGGQNTRIGSEPH